MKKYTLPFPKNSETFRRDQQWVIGGAPRVGIDNDLGATPSSSTNICATSKDNVVPDFRSGEGGVNPTVALQKQKLTSRVIRRKL